MRATRLVYSPISQPAGLVYISKKLKSGNRKVKSLKVYLYGKLSNSTPVKTRTPVKYLYQ